MKMKIKAEHRSDMILLFLTKILRLFSYGAISVFFIQYLLEIKNLSQHQISILQTCIVIGDIVISIFLTTQADKIGRKKTLVAGAILKVFTGVFYALSQNIIILAISGILGVISVTGGEIGPFMPIEQSALTQIIQENDQITKQELPTQVSLVFGYYNMAGYFAQALGAAFAGFYIQFVMNNDIFNRSQAMFQVMLLYSVFGGLKAILYQCLTGSVQAKSPKQKKILNCTGITNESVPTILNLSLLFMVDAWAGGFVMQAYLSYFYEQRFGLKFSELGLILFLCNIVGGLSGVVSSKLVSKIGAMATMIFTHLPSNIFLLLIAFCPVDMPLLATGFLIGRFCISQMDVPARQTYVSMAVSSEQRSAANGITNIVRSVGLSMSFPIAAIFMKAQAQSFTFAIPFLIAGGTKIAYDLTLGACFLWKEKEKTKIERGGKIKQTELEESITTENMKTTEIDNLQRIY